MGHSSCGPYSTVLNPTAPSGECHSLGVGLPVLPSLTNDGLPVAPVGGGSRGVGHHGGLLVRWGLGWWVSLRWVVTAVIFDGGELSSWWCGSSWWVVVVVGCHGGFSFIGTDGSVFGRSASVAGECSGCSSAVSAQWEAPATSMGSQCLPSAWKWRKLVVRRESGLTGNTEPGAEFKSTTLAWAHHLLEQKPRNQELHSEHAQVSEAAPVAGVRSKGGSPQILSLLEDLHCTSHSRRSGRPGGSLAEAFGPCRTSATHLSL